MNPKRIYINLTYFACMVFFILAAVKAVTMAVFEDEVSFYTNIFYFIINKNPVPVYVNYPTFYSYFLFVPTFIALMALMGIKGFTLDALWQDVTIPDFIFTFNDSFLSGAGRFSSIALSVAVLLMVIKFCRKRYGERVSFLAAACLILDPSGQYLKFTCWALPEMLVTFLILLAVYECILYAEQLNCRSLIFGGVFCGLAIASKFNAFLALFPLLAAPLIKRDKNIMILYTVIILAVGISFFAGTPLLFLQPEIYSFGFALESDILFHADKGSFSPLKYFWLVETVWAFSPVMFVLIVLGTGYTLKKFGNEEKVFLSLLIPSLLILGALKKQNIGYMIYLYPFFAVQIARLLSGGIEIAKRKNIQGPAVIAIVLVFCSFMPRLYRDMAQSVKVDNRVVAAQWIEAHIPNRSKLLMDWQYGPRVLQTMLARNIERNAGHIGSRNIAVLREFLGKNNQYERIDIFNDINYNLGHAKAADAEYLVVSRRFYKRFYGKRQSDRYLYGMMMSEEDIDRIRKFYTKLQAGELDFTLVRKFNSGSGPVISIYKREVE